MERRTPTPRYLTKVPARLLQAGGSIATEILVLNISTQGCRVKEVGPLAVGEVYELAIRWRGKAFRRDVKLRWKNRNGEAGLEFLSMDEAGLTFLRELFATLRLEPLRPRFSHRTA